MLKNDENQEKMLRKPYIRLKEIKLERSLPNTFYEEAKRILEEGREYGWGIALKRDTLFGGLRMSFEKNPFERASFDGGGSYLAYTESELTAEMVVSALEMKYRFKNDGKDFNPNNEEHIKELADHVGGEWYRHTAERDYRIGSVKSSTPEESLEHRLVFNKPLKGVSVMEEEYITDIDDYRLQERMAV